MKPPVIYYGAKTRVADQIVRMFPDHAHYIEPYCGSLAVLLAKPPSKMETVNDLDGDLVHFWRMLRNRTAELERACALTPHSLAEALLHRRLQGPPPPVEVGAEDLTHPLAYSAGSPPVWKGRSPSRRGGAKE